MSPISEIEAIKNLDDTLSDLQDPATRDRVLQWAWDKFASKGKSQTTQIEVEEQGGDNKKIKTTTKAKATKKTKPASKNKSSTPTLIKDLNLNASGKKSFKSFVEEKQPKSNQEKCTVAVYYLRHELELESVSTNHIFTCYKNVGWRVTDLYNIVRLTASRKGWLDTSNSNDIKTTPHGENLVELDLPKKSKSK